MNCSTQIYHQNEFGFSRKCTCQGAVHLTFGNISLLLTRPQLNDFASYITDLCSMETCVEDKDERCIFLPTRDCSLMFALSLNEMNDLSDLLDHTMIMLEVDQALSPDDSFGL